MHHTNCACCAKLTDCFWTIDDEFLCGECMASYQDCREQDEADERAGLVLPYPLPAPPQAEGS
jgi:hypothetical protein